MTHKWKSATAAVAILSVVFTGSASVLAQSISRDSALEAQLVRAANFETRRAEIMALGHLTYNADAHLKHLVALLDITKLRGLHAKRDALAALGITLNRRVTRGEMIVSAVIHGKEKIISTRSAVAVPAVPQKFGVEKPDGAEVALRRDDDPQTLEEAEDWADEQIATADALEDEWTATSDDIQTWLNENGGLECSGAITQEMPDGAGSRPLAKPDCVQKAWEALTSAASVVLSASTMRTLTQASTSTLRALIGGYVSAFNAGTITAEAMAEMVAGTIADFVATINIGWIAAGVLIAGAAYFAYEWAHCYFFETHLPLVW